MGKTAGLRHRSRRFRWALALLVLVAAFAPGIEPPASAATVRYPNVPLASWRAEGVGSTVLLVGDTLYVGGSFSTVRSPDGRTAVTRNNLAAFDVRTGALLPGFTANTNGVVRKLAYAGGRLYVAGSYTSINGVARSRVAAVNPSTGAVDGAFRADANSNVYGIAVGGNQLYLGGSFSSVNSVSRSRVASVNLVTGAVSPYAPVMNNTVSSVAADAAGTTVYLGGPFTMLSGFSSPWLAKTNAAGQRLPVVWDQLQGPALDLELNADATRLAVAQSGAGNQGAWYDTTTGARRWRQRCDGDAQAVHVIEDTMLTGFHEACDGDTTQRLTANDIANGARDPLFRARFDRFFGVWGIDGDAGHLVIAGDFTNVSGVAVQGFAIFTDPANVPTTTTTTSTTTTTVPPTTTTTTAPPTTTTTTTLPTTPGSLFTSTFTGANGAGWPGWTSSVGAGSVTIQGNGGQLAFNDSTDAYARSVVNGMASRADSSVLLSYRWSSNAPGAYFNVYARGSGGWQNAYRPRNGYGLELSSSSSTVTVRKNDNATLSTLASVSGGQAVSTAKQWLRLRVVGTTIQFKTWLDGQAEPAAWRSTTTDASVTGAGQLAVSVVRGGANVGAKNVVIDDVTITGS